MALLLVGGRRLAAPRKESVHQGAQMQKLFEPANAGLTGRRRGGIAVLAAKIRPRHGNVGAAAVRQFHQQQRFAAALEPADHPQRPALKGMAGACDRHRGRKVMVTGSLKMFPSTTSTITI
jgi:hypothetical protein